MSVVAIDGVSFKYHQEMVLNNIVLDINKGAFISLLGPNGSGKTTLLKNICKLLKPESGDIDLLGLPLNHYKNKDLAKSIAVVHQSLYTEFDFAVKDVVLMGRYPHQKQFQSESKEDYDHVESALLATDTLHLKDKSIKEISGGERQRVMIARALAQDTQILLLDEPISHLDIKYQIEILKLCRTLNLERGMTVFATLHDINLASRFSDQIVLMKSGEIHAIGAPIEVITEDNIQSVYDIEVSLMKMHNQLFVMPC